MGTGNAHVLQLDGPPIGEYVFALCSCGWREPIFLIDVDSAEKLRAKLLALRTAHVGAPADEVKTIVLL